MLPNGADKGTFPDNANQALMSNQPVYQAGGLNGHPTMRFDGSDFLSIIHNVELNITANQDFEIFSVIKQISDGGDRGLYTPRVRPVATTFYYIRMLIKIPTAF